MAHAGMARRVLLFGTSANPPTGATGHMGMLAHCRAALGFDEVWLVPVYQHIYSTKRQLAPFADRLAMCRIGVDELPPLDGGAKVVISESERELHEHVATLPKDEQPASIGSIDLVRFLIAKHPDTAFTMLVGADAYADLVAGKWKSGDELQRLVELLVIQRVGVAQAESFATVPSDRVTYLKIPELTLISSTIARAATSVEEMAPYVSPAVIDYIISHKLYAFADAN